MQNNHRMGRAVAAASAQMHDRLRADINEVAAKTLAVAEGLDASDRQFLKDIQRESRYQFKWITRMVILASRCPDDSDAFALAERLEAWVRRGRNTPVLSIAEALQRETEAQGRCDLAEIRLAQNPTSPSALVHAEVEATRHMAALGAFLATVQRRRTQLATA